MILRPILLALVVAAPAIAQAADADMLLDAPEVGLVEARSGVYLRGDVSYDIAGDGGGTRVLALPGNLLATPIGGGFDDAVGVGAGVGYRFNDMLRGDATIRYAEPERTTAPFLLPGCGTVCAGFDAGDVGTLELLANAYLDLGTVMGITPYLGAGLGAVRLDYGDTSLAACGPASCAALPIRGEDDWRFAYALNAGVSYDLSQSLTLDLGYRFLDTEGGDAWATSGAVGPGVAVSDDGLRRHSISLGLRFDLP